MKGRMGRSHIVVLLEGFVLLILATVAYLAAIWTSEITSERFGLSGVLFMGAGLVALRLGRLMSPVPTSMRWAPMTTDTAIAEITPLEDRAVRRFEAGLVFHRRCYAKAHQLKETQPGDEPWKRLRDAMRALQETDESIHDEAPIIRGVSYLGANLTDAPCILASAPEREALKAAVRHVLSAVGIEL